MKKKLSGMMLTLLFIAGFLFSSSAIMAQDNKEERKVSGFSEISISISADVYLSQGDEEKLVLEGEQDDLEEIETEVKGNNLKIKYKGTFNFGKIEKVKVYITAKNIEEINIAGSADLEAKTSIKADNIEFKVSGSGEIHIDDLTVNDINAAISGSGDIVLGGSQSVEEMEIAISGSGDLDSENLQMKRAEITVSGSGGCKVHVTDDLEVAISGSGKVYYKGSPVINARVSGSGKVRSMD